MAVAAVAAAAVQKVEFWAFEDCRQVVVGFDRMAIYGRFSELANYGL